MSGGAGAEQPSSEEPAQRRGFLARPRVRLVIARVVVGLGVLLGLIGVVSARYGWLFAGIILIGLGAGYGPWRLRR